MKTKYFLISVEHRMPSKGNDEAIYVVIYSNGIKKIVQTFESSSIENTNIPTIIEECTK